MSDSQTPDNGDEESEKPPYDSSANREGDELDKVEAFYEDLASAIDTRIGYNIAVKIMLSDKEDVIKRAQCAGAVEELNLLRREFTGVGNYFLHSDDADDEDDPEDGGGSDVPVRSAPREVPLDRTPSAIPKGFRLQKDVTDR